MPFLSRYSRSIPAMAALLLKQAFRTFMMLSHTAAVSLSEFTSRLSVANLTNGFSLLKVRQALFMQLRRRTDPVLFIMQSIHRILLGPSLSRQ